MSQGKIVGATILVLLATARSAFSDEWGRMGGAISGAGQHAGGVISGAGQHAGGVISNNFQQGVQGAGQALSRVDPSVAIRQTFERERAQAMANLPRFHPEQIFNQVQNALNHRITDEIRARGVAYNTNTGDLDLRGTSMGRALYEFITQFAQGNNRHGSVDQFVFNVPNRRLTVRLTARHCQSWGMLPGVGHVDLYDVTQHASFGFDFSQMSASYDLDLGPFAPRYNSQSYAKMQEGDLIGAAQLLAPNVGNLIKYNRTDEYEARLRAYANRYGAQNVYFASKQFVDWTTPETAARYVANGIISLGESVYPEIMGDLRQQAQHELPLLAQWVEQRGMNNAMGVAGQLLSGQTPPWPFLKFEMIPIRYFSSEALIGGGRTPEREVNHMAFVIIWQNQAQNNGGNAGLAIQMGGMQMGGMQQGNGMPPGNGMQQGGGMPPGNGMQPGGPPQGGQPTPVRELVFVNQTNASIQLYARWQDPQTGGAIDQLFNNVGPGQSVKAGVTRNPLIFAHVNFIDFQGNITPYVDGNDVTLSTPSGKVGMRGANADVQGNFLVVRVVPPQ